MICLKYIVGTVRSNTKSAITAESSWKQAYQV